MVLQQLPHDLPAPLIQQFFQPGGREPGTYCIMLLIAA